MTAPDPTAGEREGCCSGASPWHPEHLPASPPAVAASTGTSEDVGLREVIRLAAEKYLSDFDTVMNVRSEARDLAVMIDRAVLASDWLAAREAAARAEERERIAQAQRCGGCKGQGSHRRHCPRHPNYHPWIPLADRAESIGDSIGEPGLANQAWALAGAIREQMPNHPYRPVRHRSEG